MTAKPMPPDTPRVLNYALFDRIADALADQGPNEYDQGRYTRDAVGLYEYPVLFAREGPRAGRLEGFRDERAGKFIALDPNDLREPLCATPCCIAGWACILEDVRLDDLDHDRDALDIETPAGIIEITMIISMWAARALGLPSTGHHKLFGTEWPRYWAKRVPGLSVDPPTHMTQTFAPTHDDAIRVCRAIAAGTLDPEAGPDAFLTS